MAHLPHLLSSSIITIFASPHDMRSKLDEPLLPLDTERQERMRACLPRVSRCHLPELTDYF